MKKVLKFSIIIAVLILGTAFLKLGGNDSFWSVIISIIGSITVLLPAYLWYNDKLNM